MQEGVVVELEVDLVRTERKPLKINTICAIKCDGIFEAKQEKGKCAKIAFDNIIQNWDQIILLYFFQNFFSTTASEW